MTWGEWEGLAIALCSALGTAGWIWAAYRRSVREVTAFHKELANQLPLPWEC